MKKLGSVFCALFLLFLIGMPVQAQPQLGPQPGTYDSGLGMDQFEAGDWQELLWGTGEGKLGNEIEAGSSDYTLDAAFLDTVTLIKEPGSPPEPPDDYFEYETFYVGGTVLLFNFAAAPWNNPLDPNAVFIVDLKPTKVVTKKFVDGGERIEFTLTATGKFRHYDDLFADIEAFFEGEPNFDFSGYPVIMSGELNRAQITIRGPLDVSVHFDVKPGSCPNPINPKSKGVLPAAILGSSDFDVTTIDPASVRLRLQGSDVTVAPIRWAVEDVATPFASPDAKEDCFSDCNNMGPDGYLDLTLKFDTQEVIAALGEFSAEACLVLEVVGNLEDEQNGGTILGEDVVRMLKSKSVGNPSPNGNWNKVMLFKAE
jgi:hypothetical protein